MAVDKEWVLSAGVSFLLNYNDTEGSVYQDRDLLTAAPGANSTLTQYRSHLPEGRQRSWWQCTPKPSKPPTLDAVLNITHLPVR